MKAKKIRFIGVVSAILCTSLAFLAVLLSTMSVVRAASCPDNVLRVKKGASGAADGCSWDDAYPELQLALSSAESGDQIWVASGVYTPGLMVTDSFEIPPAVQVYGGFAGIEDALEQRNWQANKTVFSGDIGGDDIVDEDGVVVTATHIVGDNSYHVLFLDGTSTPITETTILDGVIVTAGYAHGDSWYETRGGGMLCYGTGENSDCSPTLMNVLFSGNQTSNVGGAMYNDGSYSGNSDPSLTHVIFSQNYAEFDGGAMYNAGHDQGNSSPVLSDVVFIRNWAYFDGGAVYNTGRFDGISNPSFISVTFDSNVGYYGGALVNEGIDGGTSSPIFTDVVFIENKAQSGGALWNWGYGGMSQPILSNVIFQDNFARYFGGGIFNDGNEGNTSLQLKNGAFYSNTAGSSGGAIYDDARAGLNNSTLINVVFSGNSANVGGAINFEAYMGESNPSLTNVLFSGNRAEVGGAIVNSGLSGAIRSKITNVTFSQNKANLGGAIVGDCNASSVCEINLENAILWGNEAISGTQIYNTEVVLTVTNSLIEEGWNGDGVENISSVIINGGDNLDEDPLFVDKSGLDGIIGTRDDNLRLQVGSPAINAGDNDLVPISVTVDLDGKPRILNGVVDMGAYEALWLESYLPLIVR